MASFGENVKHIYKRIFFQSDALTVVLASAHKVGSTWLFNLLQDVGNFEGSPVPDELNESGTLLLEKPGSIKFLKQLKGRKIFKSHSYPIRKGENLNVKFISIYRDPRDVVVSGAFYLANLEKEKGGWGKEQSLLSDKEKIKYFIANGQWCIDRLKAWYNDENAFKIKYELLLTDTAAQVKNLLAFLEIEANDEKITDAIEKNSFSKKSGRKQGEEDKSSFYRKGISGDWKNYFDEEVKDHFKTALNGEWKNLLIEMEYEKNAEW